MLNTVAGSCGHVYHVPIKLPTQRNLRCVELHRQVKQRRAFHIGDILKPKKCRKTRISFWSYHFSFVIVLSSLSFSLIEKKHCVQVPASCTHYVGFDVTVQLVEIVYGNFPPVWHIYASRSRISISPCMNIRSGVTIFWLLSIWSLV